ncbi:hypothetical protein [Thermostilla marina]
MSSPPDLFVDVDLPTQTFSGKYWNPTASGTSTTILDVASGDLAQFIVTGLYQTTPTIEDRSTCLAGRPLAYINEKYVISDARLQVAYTYTPAATTVPEPTSAQLLLTLTIAGLAFLIVFQRPRLACSQKQKS